MSEPGLLGTGTDVAIIGMSGRFPGADNIDRFWENLKAGVESFMFYTDEELAEAGVSADLLKNPQYVKSGGGIYQGKEYFDAGFFGYKPAEAEILDPQTRVLMECSWEALENAGYMTLDGEALIGLYAGSSDNFQWKALSLLSGKQDQVPGFMAALLTDKDQMVTWICYHLNLRGPGVVIKSACSTSLVAIHIATQAILNGECDMALAGGVTLMTGRPLGYLYQEGMVTSADGHCRAFDEKATGFVNGEGAGLVVLKALENALADRDFIYAVIKGSAINNDGNRKVGYTAPSIVGQAEVIRMAYQVADIIPDSLSYIETHGSATKMGDPIEIEALKLAFHSDQRMTCAVGAVKSNVGHLDSASGVTGLIKVVLSIFYRQIPPSLHFHTPNPGIDFANSPFFVNNRLRPWESTGTPLRAGVSSFGIGGTNVHVVLEEAPPREIVAEETEETGTFYRLLLLSAKTESALDTMTKNLIEFFKKNPGISLKDVAYTLQVGRESFKYRRALVCQSIPEAIELFSTNSRLVKTDAVRVESEALPLIFMFAGQGSQYVNMGLGLYRTIEEFRQEVDRCFTLLEPIMGVNVKQVLFPGAARGQSLPVESGKELDIDRTAMTQPIVFVFEYALARMLMKWGIQPRAMIGYSLGEYVAACVSGVLSLSHALELVALRGKLMQEVPEGAMVSVPLPEMQVRELLKKDENSQLSLAIINEPTCIVAGPVQTITSFEQQLRAMKIMPIRLNSFHAAHSQLMSTVMEEFARKLEQVTLKEPQIPYISNVTGRWIRPQEAIDPRYWVEQLQGTVRFSDGLSTLLEEESSIFIEIGPGRVLGTYVRQHPARKEEHRIINLVRHQQEEIEDDYLLISRLAQLWLNGKSVNWALVDSRENGQRIPLPTYPFARERFWSEGDPFKLGFEMMGGDGMAIRKPDMADWFYIPSWKRTRLPSGGKKTGPARRTLSRCLIFSNPQESQLEISLIKRLQADNVEIIRVKPGPVFIKENSHQFIIDPGDAHHMFLLLKELEEEGKIALDVLHLWTLGKEVESARGNELNYWLNRGFYTLIFLSQAIGKLSVRETFYVTVISDGMQDVLNQSVVFPQKATLMAAVEVIPKEYDNIFCRSIDVEIFQEGRTGEDFFIEFIQEEMTMAHPDRVIAYRGNQRWSRCFEPYRLEAPVEETPRLRKQGVYLVTGGLGGIGLELAGCLAEKVQARLVLTTRSPFPPREQWEQWLVETHAPGHIQQKIKKIKELEQMGAEVRVITADVADRIQMATLISQVKERLGAINGVIHAAGLPDYGGMIQRRNRQSIDDILSAKLQGTVLLEELFREEKIDFMIFCSSLASVQAPYGQVAYTAANMFLDAFAQSQNRAFASRSENNRLVVSINWDAWQEVGFGVEAVKHMNEDPLIILRDAVKPAEGKEILVRVLADKLSQVVVATRDLARLSRQRDIPETRQIEELESKKDLSSRVSRRPDLSSDYVGPGNQFEVICTEFFQKYLGIEQVGIEDNFFELGASSLDIIHISNKLKERLRKEISPVVMFEHPTIAALSGFLQVPDAGEKPVTTSLERSGKLTRGKDKLKMLKDKQRRN